ncbi:MAG TPA: hypothetical protein VIC55_05275 [Gemmatimonadaceae bacterium]|jgi:hypothetical protein
MPFIIANGRARWMAAPAALLAVAWLPSVRAPRAGATVAPAGSYVLASAASARPPIPFQFQMGGATVAGTVDSARIVLAADSTFTDQVTVRWLKAPSLPIPIPGLRPGPDAHVLTGAGHYSVQGERMILEPSDWITRGLISTVEARSTAGSLTLTSMSGGLAGSHVRLNAVFTRAR